MGTGVQVANGEIITHNKMNLKLETVAEGPINILWPPVRLPDIIYQNTTPRTKSVIISVKIQLIGVDSYGYYKLLIGHASDLSDAEVHGQISLSHPPGNVDLHGTCTAFVPPGWYYMLYTNIGGEQVCLVEAWIEMQI